MARRKNLPESVRTKCSLAERLRAVRAELFGERGGPEMARRLGLPIRTWYNYEAGVTVPAEVVLRFMELTSVESVWLLHGQGPKFRPASPIGLGAAGPDSVEALLRTALDRLERKAAGTPQASNSVEGEAEGAETPGHHEAPDREWLLARREGRCIRVGDDAMTPIVSDGAEVAFAEIQEDLDALDGKLVVAWVDGEPIVRWLQRSGHFAMLRAENPGPHTATQLVDLNSPAEGRKIRRVLWIGTRH